MKLNLDDYIRVASPVRRGYKDRVWWVKRLDEHEDQRNIEVEKKEEKEGKEVEEEQPPETGVYFFCKNCGFYEAMKPKTMLYKKNIGTQQDMLSLESYKNMMYDTTLPRTKKYKCFNEKCITHTEPEKKEAVWFRLNNSFNTCYECCVCQTVWKI